MENHVNATTIRRDNEWSECLLKLVARTNNFDYLHACRNKDYIPFCICGNKVGVVTPPVLAELRNYPDVFDFVDTNGPGSPGKSVHLKKKYTTEQERSDAFALVLNDLRAKDKFKALKGWRNETFSIYFRRGDPPLCHVERSGCPLFGFIQYGVHVNGYTYKDGEMMMWVGRRSKTKPTYPNMLDNMCAGGLASGLTVRECAIKECQEEASVDDENLKNLSPVGTISYCYTDERGILADTEYLFDLELSPDFVPTNADGEVENFYLFTLKEVQDRIIAGEFKANCCLVIVDFLMRHGFMTHDDEPNYSYLSERMHMSIQPPF